LANWQMTWQTDQPTTYRTIQLPIEQSNYPITRLPNYQISSLFPLRLHIDGELLAFLVQVAALDAERPGRLGDAMTVGIQLGQHDLTLECGNAIRERPASRRRPARQLTS